MKQCYQIAVEDCYAQQAEPDKALVKFPLGTSSYSNGYTSPKDTTSVSCHLLSHSEDASMVNPHADYPFSKPGVEAASSISLSGDALVENGREERKGNSHLKHISTTSRATPDLGNVHITSRRWPTQSRSRIATARVIARVNNKTNVQLQALQAQNIALEAQAAL